MKNIYKIIWADALHQTKLKNPNIDNGSLIWENLSFLSIITSFNLGVIVIGVSYYLGLPFQLKLGLLMPGSLIDGILSGVIQLYLPSIVFNYFVVFFKNKHLKIMDKYPSKGGKAVLTYIYISLGIIVLAVILTSFFKIKIF